MNAFFYLQFLFLAMAHLGYIVDKTTTQIINKELALSDIQTHIPFYLKEACQYTPAAIPSELWRVSDSEKFKIKPINSYIIQC